MSACSPVNIRLSPLNQIAALKLKAAGVTAQPDELAIFQLMQWGLVEGIEPTHNRTAAELLRLRMLPNQESAFHYLIGNLPGGLLHFEQLLLKLKPRAAAEALLDLLDQRLKADSRCPYPEGGE